MPKKVIDYETATERFMRGVEAIDILVGGTIGPSGRNRIIYRKYGSPLVTNDGATVARHVYMDDVIEDLAVQTLVEIAMKTNDVAGDGTTSATVEACALIRSSLKRLENANKLSEVGGNSLSAMQLAREIRKEMPKALELLKKQQRDITGEDLKNVIATSLENLEYGDMLAKVMQEVGKDGYISIEDNWATKYGVETEVTNGMRFLGTYASPYLATSENQKDAIWEDTKVLVTNQHIERIGQLKKLMDQMKAAGTMRLVIIGGFSEGANAFGKEAIKTIAQTMEMAAKGQTMIEILLIKAPTLTSVELEDVACFCNAKFIDKNLDMKLDQVELVHLGDAKKVAANEDDVNIVGGAGNTEQRIKVLREQIEREKDPMFEEKTKRRIASLASGVGIIRVGAPTEQERTYLKHKLEDAKNAAKAAMSEGVVPGGGLALKLVADELGKDHILYDALMAPFVRIRENHGSDLDVGPNILDAYKVVRLGFENACSAGGTLITCDAGIAERRTSIADMFDRKIVAQDERSDFRDDENQDIARSSRRLA